jgi:hypothetical protein
MFQDSPWAHAENVEMFLDKSSISFLQCILLQQCHLFYMLHTMASLITHTCTPLFYMAPECWELNFTPRWTREDVEVKRGEEEETQKKNRNKRTANEIDIRLLMSVMWVVLSNCLVKGLQTTARERIVQKCANWTNFPMSTGKKKIKIVFKIYRYSILC